MEGAVSEGQVSHGGQGQPVWRIRIQQSLACMLQPNQRNVYTVGQEAYFGCQLQVPSSPQADVQKAGRRLRAYQRATGEKKPDYMFARVRRAESWIRMELIPMR